MSAVAMIARRRRPPTTAAALLLGATLALSGCHTIGHKGKPKTPTVGDRIPILSRIESGAKADDAIASAQVTLPAGTVNPGWPQAGNTPNKAYPPLSLSATPRLAWSATIEGSSTRRRLAAAPVIGGGKLFVMDTGGTVRCFDAATGALRWSHAFEDRHAKPAVLADTPAEGKRKAKKQHNFADNGAGSIFGGGVSYDGGKVYVTTGLGDVAALDADTGAQAWKVRPAGPLRGSPTIAYNAVFVMTQDNQIFAIDVADGKPLWNESASTTQAGVFGVAAPAAGQSTVIAGYSSGEVVAYRYENGRQLWSDALSRTSLSTVVGALTDVDADPIIDRGQVFALGQGGRMAAYDLVSGQRIWELNLAGISTPAVGGEWVFTLTDEAKLLAIARNTGKVRWLTDLQRYRKPKKRGGPIFWTGPVLAGDRLWVANSLGQIMTVSVTDGKPSLFTKLKDPVTLAPVVANQVLYVLDDKGRISAFR